MIWSKIRNRIAFQEVPASGYVLAYTRKEVIFKKYTSIEELDTIFQKTDCIEIKKNDKLLAQEILEIHLFDKEKEYRAIASKSKRKILNEDLCAIEHIAKIDEEDDETVYKERIMLEPTFVESEDGAAGRYITVYNRISYEHGMAKIYDYRLAMEG